MPIQVKRIYEPPTTEDGIRILIDRLWPRGVSKEMAKIDIWLREIAPSHHLRKFYGHLKENHKEFKYLYEKELDEICLNAVKKVLELAKTNQVTLLYAAKDPTYNHAVILLDYLGQCKK